MKVMAYLRVSTSKQETEKNIADVVEFAESKKLPPVEFTKEKVSGKINWKQRKIKNVIDDLDTGDVLIVPELSRLGRAMLEVMEILAVAKEKEITVYAVKGGWELNGTIQSKVMAMVFSMAAEIERDFISQRVTEGLKAARARGVKLGRPKGPGKSKLDQFRDEIEAMLKNGSTKAFIARKYGVTSASVFNWLRKNSIAL